MLLINTVEDYEAFLQKIDVFLARDEPKIVFMDTEGTGLDPRTSILTLVSLSIDDMAYVIDFTKIPLRLISYLAPLLVHKDTVKVWHNVTHDWKQLYHFAGVSTAPVHCTYIVEQLLKAGLFMSGFSLKEVAARRTGSQLDKSVREGFIARDPSIPFTQEEIEYAAKDAIVLKEIYKQQMFELEAEDLLTVYAMEMELAPITAKMEYDGIAIDRSKLEAVLPIMDERIKKIDLTIQEMVIRAGAVSSILFDKDGMHAVNIASNKQMLATVRAMGIEVESMNKKELSDWDNKWRQEQLNKPHVIGERGEEEDEDEFSVGYEHPFLRRLAIRTGIAKLKSTYVEGLLKVINPVTDRVHPNAKQCGAVATGRYSFSAPNLQNLPNRMRLESLDLADHDIRSMFIAPKNKKLIIADYAGIELVILAALSQDENLIAQLKKGDIHSFVASRLFKVDVNADNKEVKPYKVFRDVAKRVNYGIAYGSSGWNLYRTMNFDLASVGFAITPDDGDAWVATWKELFPRTGQLLDENAMKAITQFYTTSVLGRRRRWPRDIRVEKRRMFAAMREGMNQPIQSSSADMTKTAMILFNRSVIQSLARIVICVHDELVIESDEVYVDEAAQVVKNAMETAGRVLFPNIDPVLITVKPKISDCYNK